METAVMSLIISNRLTDKQKEFLKQLGYYGNLNLSVAEAAEIIDGLLEQQRQELEAYNAQFNHDYIKFNGDYYDIF